MIVLEKNTTFVPLMPVQTSYLSTHTKEERERAMEGQKNERQLTRTTNVKDKFTNLTVGRRQATWRLGGQKGLGLTSGVRLGEKSACGVP